MRWDARTSSAATFGVITSVTAVVLIVMGSRGWFIFDDWTFLGSRRALLEQGDVGGYFFLPHNEHLSATFIAWHFAITHVFGIDSYLPTMVSLLLLDVVLVVVLRQLMIKMGVRHWVASLTPPILLLWGPAASWVLWGFDGSFVAAVTAVLAQALLVWHDGPVNRRDVAGAVIIVLGVGAQTLALIGVVVIAAVLVAHRRYKAALVAAMPVVTLYLAWHFTYGQRPAVYQWTSYDPPVDVPTAPIGDQLRFFGRLSSTVSDGFFPFWIGLVLVPALLVAIVVGTIRRRDPALGAVLGAVAIALGFALAVSRQRAIVGSHFATSERYVFVPTVLLFPVFVLGLQRAADRVVPRTGKWPVLAGAAVLAGVVLTANIISFDSKRHEIMRVMHVTERHITALADAEGLDRLPGDVRVNMFSWDFNIDHLRSLRDDWLISPDPDPLAGLAADLQASYFIRSEPAQPGDTTPGRGGYHFGLMEPGSPGCVVSRPEDISTWGRVWMPVSSVDGTPVSFDVTTSVDDVEFVVRKGEALTVLHQIRVTTDTMPIRVTTAAGYEAFLILPANAEVCDADLTP